jgi:hypothetical protein
MREFSDGEGRTWIATALEEEGTDYKGRFFLSMRPVAGGEPVELRDVRWNSRRTARRTIDTMSVVELRRRLRSAAGRAPAVVAPSFGGYVDPRGSGSRPPTGQ